MEILARGHTCRDVSIALGITYRTATNHLQNLMRKLNLHNRASLVRWAIANGLVPVPKPTGL